jgi:hypothetical protein
MNMRRRAIPAVTAPMEDEAVAPGNRFRSLRVFLGVYLVLATSVALTWGVWLHRANTAIARELAAARARGEPVDPQQFVAPAVPEEQNAAFYILRAGLEYHEDVIPNELWEQSYDAPYLPEVIAAIRAGLARNREALADVRRARNCDRVDWKFRPGIDPLMFGNGAYADWNRGLNAARELAQLCRYAAVEAAARGDDAAAVEYVRDILALRRAVAGQAVEISYFAALAMDQLAARATRDVACRMILPGRVKAPRQATNALIAQLLDDRERTACAIRAAEGSRMIMLGPPARR